MNRRSSAATDLLTVAALSSMLAIGCRPAPHPVRASYADRPETARYEAYLEPRLRPVGTIAPREEWWSFAGHDVHLDRIVPPARARSTKVILVHGGGGNGRLLAPFGVLLARHGYEVVAPDLPPYGLTRPSADGALTWEGWIDLTSALARRESDAGARPIVLFGLSIGGMTAVQAAERTPEVVATIATCLLDLRDPEILSLAAGDGVLARAGVFFTKHAPWLTGGLWLPAREVAPLAKLANDPSLARLAEDDPLVGGARAPGSFWRSVHRPRHFTPADQVRKPVLLVHPGDDRWTPAEVSLRFFDRIAAEDKRALVLRHGGHYPIEPEATAELEAAVITFLEAREATRR